MARRALILVEEGFDDFEYFYSRHRLEEMGFEVLVAAGRRWSDVPVYDPDTGELRPRPRMVRGKHGTEVRVDLSFREALERIEEFDVLVLPGGRGPERARRFPEAPEIVRRMVEAGKPVLAICHGPQLLVSAGVARGRRMTAYWGIRDDIVNAGAVYVDEDAVRDGNVVTVRHPTVLGRGFRLFAELLRERGLAEAC